MINFEGSEWKEIEAYLKAELLDKPLDIKTEGKSAEEIALEVRALQIANQKINKLIVGTKGLSNKPRKTEERYI